MDFTAEVAESAEIDPINSDFLICDLGAFCGKNMKWFWTKNLSFGPLRLCAKTPGLFQPHATRKSIMRLNRSTLSTSTVILSPRVNRRFERRPMSAVPALLST